MTYGDVSHSFPDRDGKRLAVFNSRRGLDVHLRLLADKPLHDDHPFVVGAGCILDFEVADSGLAHCPQASVHA